MCFGEYEMINKNIYPTSGLKDKIKQAIYFSGDAQEVYNSLLSLQGEVNKYWSKIDRNDIKNIYLMGVCPFPLLCLMRFLFIIPFHYWLKK